MEVARAPMRQLTSKENKNDDGLAACVRFVSNGLGGSEDDKHHSQQHSHAVLSECAEEER